MNITSIGTNYNTIKNIQNFGYRFDEKLSALIDRAKQCGHTETVKEIDTIYTLLSTTYGGKHMLRSEQFELENTNIKKMKPKNCARFFLIKFGELLKWHLNREPNLGNIEKELIDVINRLS